MYTSLYSYTLLRINNERGVENVRPSNALGGDERQPGPDGRPRRAAGAVGRRRGLRGVLDDRYESRFDVRDLCCFVSCDLVFVVVVFEFFSLERRRCVMQTLLFFSRCARSSRLCRALLPLAILLLTGDNAFAWAKSFVVDPPTDEN